MASFLLQGSNTLFPQSIPFENSVMRSEPSINPSFDQTGSGPAFPRGVKRKGSYQKPNIPTKQHAQQFFCELCHIQLNSSYQAEQHKSGKIHRAKIKLLGNLPENSTDSAAGNTHAETASLPTQLALSASVNPIVSATNKTSAISLICVVCRKIFNSKIQAEQHFNSLVHQRKSKGTFESNKQQVTTQATIPPSFMGTVVKTTAEQSLLPKSEGTVASATTALQTPGGEVEPVGATVDSGRTKGPGNLVGMPNVCTISAPSCEACGLNFNSEKQFEQHMSSPKHSRRVAELSKSYSPATTAVSGTESKSLSAVSLLYCQSCDITFNSGKQLLQHMNSPKHMRAEQRKQQEPTPVPGVQGSRQRGGRGRGQGRGSSRGAFRGKPNMAGIASRGIPAKSHVRPPPLFSSFVKGRTNHVEVRGGPTYPSSVHPTSGHPQQFYGANTTLYQPFA